jgi:hypothetical protein
VGEVVKVRYLGFDGVEALLDVGSTGIDGRDSGLRVGDL